MPIIGSSIVCRLSPVLLLLALLLLLSFNVEAKRRMGARNWQFEARPGMGNLVLDAAEEEAEEEDTEEEADFDEDVDQKTTIVPVPFSGSSLERTATKAAMKSAIGGNDQKALEENRLDEMVDTNRKSAAAEFEIQKEEEKARELIEQAVNMTEDGQQQLPFGEEEMWRNLSLLPEAIGKKVFWVDATFKAVDLGLNFSELPECATWKRFWSAEEMNNGTQLELFRLVKAENRSTESAEEKEGSDELVEYEIVEDGARLDELIPSSVADELLENEDYEAVGFFFKEICREHERDFFYKSPEDAKALGIGNDSIICEPFRRELHPDVEQLADLEKQMNELVGWNETEIEEKEAVKKKGKEGGEKDAKKGKTMSKRNSEEEANLEEDQQKQTKSEKEEEMLRRRKREEKPPKGGEEAEKSVKTEEEMEQLIKNKTESAADIKPRKPVQVDASDETSPLLIFGNEGVASALGLRIAPRLFQRHQRVGLFLPGICSDYVPKAIEAFNASDFEGVEIEGPIGVNISALEAAGVNLTELAEKLRNDTEVDEILSRTKDTARALGGSYILPVLNKNQYDPFSAPIVFQGSAVVVRFGIYIESISNFQTSTMDYDLDVYLMMSWRDPRLVNSFDKPILVKEEEILEKIWRPDPFFDAKEAEFHEVTFLNFLMRIFNDGLILYETRIKLKPACNLILCKYPHDKQTCELQIKSFAYPAETVRFEWFTNRKDAIDKNPDVRLPELYIDEYEPTKCNRSRKSGEFACLRAVFRLKRDVGFHIAQTYIPTSLALAFSWVGVWLPEEFMEGRIGVAITVLLTLSTESAGAREHLPSVSYLKAIDLWFGYITGFVFFTLLQTLFVIGFDKRANQLRKWATKKRRGTLELSREAREEMAERAERYHKIGRYLDNCCRVFYPLSFTLFLILYYFVLTEGQQDDCIANRR